MMNIIPLVRNSSLLLIVVLLSGCCCHSHKDVATCGEGTRAITGEDGEITCITKLTCAEGTHERRDSTTGLSSCWSDLDCGHGTHEQGTGTRRECVSDLNCGEGTLEQGTGTRRECIPTPPADE